MSHRPHSLQRRPARRAVRGAAPALAALLLALAPVAPAAADLFDWFDDTSVSGLRWNPPDEALTTVSATQADYTSLTLWVNAPGVYTVTSDQGFDGLLVLYEGGFDPARPLENAIAANDDAGSATRSSLTTRLAEGVLYVVVTSAQSPTDEGFVTSRVDGPGRIRPSTCFIGDEIHLSDSNTALALDGLRFCVVVSWEDHFANTGIGRPVGYRSADSGLFWFFRPSNWEIQVKVLDGCAVNGHHWVLFSATTDVAFTLTVHDLGLVHPSREYSNPLGRTAETVTDTAAFPCD